MFFIILLGIIQGIAEFFPISSSAHLIIFRDLFGLGKDVISDNLSLSYDVALHLGTVFAVIYIFFEDFLKLFFNGMLTCSKTKEGKLFWCVILSTIPAALFGLVFEDFIENYIRDKFILIAFSLIFVGIIIYIIDKKSKRDKSLSEITFKDAILIGLFESFALIPGFSRSGSTIAIARLLKYDRTDACKYSFYLSLPIITGAVFFELIKTGFGAIVLNITPFIIGIFVSFITGVLCIKCLLNYVQNNNFKIFMVYRIILGLFVILYIYIFR